MIFDNNLIVLILIVFIKDSLEIFYDKSDKSVACLHKMCINNC